MQEAHPILEAVLSRQSAVGSPQSGLNLRFEDPCLPAGRREKLFFFGTVFSRQPAMINDIVIIFLLLNPNSTIGFAELSVFACRRQIHPARLHDCSLPLTTITCRSRTHSALLLMQAHTVRFNNSTSSKPLNL